MGVRGGRRRALTCCCVQGSQVHGRAGHQLTAKAMELSLMGRHGVLSPSETQASLLPSEDRRSL